MSTYWTEETVTTVSKTLIKGSFTGKYYAEHRDDWSNHYSELYEMTIYDAEVTIQEIKKDVQGEFSEMLGLRPFRGTFSQPVNCYDRTSGQYFQLHLEEPHIALPALTKISKQGNEHFGTISGAIYGYITRLTQEKIKKEHERKVLSVAAVNDWANWSRTTTHEFSHINGLRYRRDYYHSVNGGYRWGNWYATNESWSFASVIRSFLGICFLVLLLIFLVNLSWPGMIIIGFILVLFLISRVRRTSFGATFASIFYGFLCLFYLACIAAALFGANNRSAVTKQVIPNKNNYTKTEPVKSSSSFPVNQRPKQPAASADEWIVHHRAWSDLHGHQYEGDVRILKSIYKQAARDHAGLSGITGLSDVYRKMTMADESRLNGTYRLFDSIKRVNNLGEKEFAEMVVSFIQNIPYSSIVDGVCNSSNQTYLTAPPGSAEYSCLGNVPYGVQSPAEFIATLQGDCDTRTLFLFTVFNHYRYRVAILGSDAFRHSLLGLGLPLPGSAKMAGNERFVLWETTSAGFTAGHLSPEIDQMDFWNFYLINTPLS